MEDISSKQDYNKLLSRTKGIVQRKIDSGLYSDNTLWNNILLQIDDIKTNIVDSDQIFDWTEIYNRYSLGKIAIQCFKEDDEMYQLLTKIFFGAVHYQELQE